MWCIASLSMHSQGEICIIDVIPKAALIPFLFLLSNDFLCNIRGSFTSIRIVSTCRRKTQFERIASNFTFQLEKIFPCNTDKTFALSFVSIDFYIRSRRLKNIMNISFSFQYTFLKKLLTFNLFRFPQWRELSSPDVESQLDFLDKKLTMRKPHNSTNEIITGLGML